MDQGRDGICVKRSGEVSGVDFPGWKGGGGGG